MDRSLAWTGDMVDSIADNNNPATTPPFAYTAQSQLFTYTPTRRLMTAQGYYGTLSWTYDANGNRASETRNGVTSTYAYPVTSNRLTSVTPSGQTGRSFAYDAAGDILTDSRTGALGMTYEYDVEGRLSKAYQTNAPSQGAVYAYDAQDRLASRTVTSGSTTTTTLYVHDLNDHIIAETNTAGQTLREYIWLNDLPVAIVDKVDTATPAIYYVHTDHFGRPARLVLAQYWHWAWDVAYGPFGEVAGVWADPGVTQDMRFPGQWFQMESGLAYNWHRHYDATLGRYVQPDPIGYAGGRSLYGYVGQNPLAWIDPKGLLDTGGGNGGGGMDICRRAFEACLRIGEQMYDNGYQEAANKQRAGCYQAHAMCEHDQHLSDWLQIPNFLHGRFITHCPPNNEGGTTIFDGTNSFYVPPTYDVNKNFPPRH